MTYDLAALGWTPAREAEFAALGRDDLVPARVGAEHRGRFLLLAASGEIDAEPAGRSRHTGEEHPAVGDWVAVRPGGGLIEAVLPRTSAFVRADRDPTRTHGHAGRQVLAANIDLAFVVTGAEGDLSARRLERYLAAAWESGAEPAVVLTKTDLVDDVPALVKEIAAACPGAPVHAVSNVSGEGVEALRALIGPGRTAVLLGSSGVGKSSLTNRLLGEERQTVSEVRADGRGKHTTTHRELFLLPGGGMVLDTPGLRLFTPWEAEGVDAAFADIEALASQCRFSDCRHQGEPGCAVAEAVRAGLIDADRVEGYGKLHREIAHLERKDDPRAASEVKRKWKVIHKAQRSHGKGRGT